MSSKTPAVCRPVKWGLTDRICGFKRENEQKECVYVCACAWVVIVPSRVTQKQKHLWVCNLQKERERKRGIRVWWHVADALILIASTRCSPSISCSLKHIPTCLSFLIGPLVGRLSLSLVKSHHFHSVFFPLDSFTHWLTYSLSHILFTPLSPLEIWLKHKEHIVSGS